MSSELAEARGREIEGQEKGDRRNGRLRPVAIKLIVIKFSSIRRDYRSGRTDVAPLVRISVKPPTHLS